MNKFLLLLTFVLIVSFSFHVISPNLEPQSRSLYLVVNGSLDKPHEGADIVLNQITINNKTINVPAGHLDQTDENGKFKLTYPIPFDSLGIKTNDSGEKLQASADNIWTKFINYVFKDKKQNQSLKLDMSVKLLVNRKYINKDLQPFNGTLAELYNSKDEVYILERKIESKIPTN